MRSTAPQTYSAHKKVDEQARMHPVIDINIVKESFINI